jgi:hypothetical protein
MEAEHGWKHSLLLERIDDTIHLGIEMPLVLEIKFYP